MPDEIDKAKPEAAAGSSPSKEGGESASLPMFYQRPEVLSQSAYAGKGLRRRAGHRFAAASHAVVLHAEEFRLACAYYPIVFADDESAVPIAILGFERGRNTFVDATGQWEADAYVPAYVRRYPFVNGRGATENDLVLYIDAASDHLVDMVDSADAEPLFVDGQPSARAKRALDFCVAFQAQAPHTSAFVAELKARDMLERRNVQVDLPGGAHRQLTGLRIIGEKAFKDLPDEVWLEWRRRGWIGLVYWHWASMDNFTRISKRA
jgi:hypothetical protein